MVHQPNFENLRRTLLRQGPPGPVPFFELFADPGMVETVLGEKFPVNLHSYIEEPGRISSSDDVPGMLKSIEMYVRFCRETGYDYVFMLTGFSLPREPATAWARETRPRIASRGRTTWPCSTRGIAGTARTSEQRREVPAFSGQLSSWVCLQKRFVEAHQK
jgi:hypothetical protein